MREAKLLLRAAEGLMDKVSYPIDKRKWCPSLIPGGVFLVSTLAKSGEPHFAPKSWVQMVSFEPPILVLSGSKGQTTEENILASREFVLNLVDESIASKAFQCIQWQGAERVEKAGFSFAPSLQLKTPVIKECKAHLECRLLETKQMGSGFLVFGEIVGASICGEIDREADLSKKYQLLRQVIFQEFGVFSVLESIRPADKATS